MRPLLLKLHLFFFSCSFFSISSIFFALLFSLPPINSRNSDPGSHSRLFSPPTHYGSCLAFLPREDFSSFFPRRLASNCAININNISIFVKDVIAFLLCYPVPGTTYGVFIYSTLLTVTATITEPQLRR